MTGPGVAIAAGLGEATTTFTPTPTAVGPQAGDEQLPVAVGAPQLAALAPPDGAGNVHLGAAAGEPSAEVREEGVAVRLSLGTVVVVDPNAARTVALQDGLALTADVGRVRIPGRGPWWFPIVARALAQLLIDAGLAESGRVGTETPVDLQMQLPFIRIVRVGGDSDLVNDYAQVDLDVYAARSVDGEHLSEAIRQYLTMPAPPYVDGFLLDRIVCLTAAIERPWADVNIRRYGATYRVVARRQPAPLP